jgi:hypothetical protein
MRASNGFVLSCLCFLSLFVEAEAGTQDSGLMTEIAFPSSSLLLSPFLSLFLSPPNLIKSPPAPHEVSTCLFWQVGTWWGGCDIGEHENLLRQILPLSQPPPLSEGGCDIENRYIFLCILSLCHNPPVCPRGVVT